MCRGAAHSSRWMLGLSWLYSHTIHETFLSRQSLDIKRLKPRQPFLHPWCVRNLPRFLMQIHSRVELRYELGYMRIERLEIWTAVSFPGSSLHGHSVHLYNVGNIAFLHPLSPHFRLCCGPRSESLLQIAPAEMASFCLQHHQTGITSDLCPRTWVNDYFSIPYKYSENVPHHLQWLLLPPKQEPSFRIFDRLVLKNRFRKVLPRGPGNPFGRCEIHSEVRRRCEVVHCLQKRVFVVTQLPKADLLLNQIDVNDATFFLAVSES